MAMRRKMIRTILAVIAFLLLAIIQRSFIWALPQPFSSISLPIIILMSYLMFSHWDRAWPALIIFGLILDSLSFHILGLDAVVLTLSFLAGEFLLKYWLTNRSLYSFAALTVLVTLVYHLIMIVSAFLLSYRDQSFSLLFQESFWMSLAYETASSIIAVSLIFYISNSISKKMKPFFVR